MKILKIQYVVESLNDLYVIKNTMTNKIELAFKVNSKLTIDKVRDYLYQGRDNVIFTKLFKYDKYFDLVPNVKTIKAYKEIRKEVSLIKSKFINSNYYKLFLDTFEAYKKKDLVEKVFFDFNSSCINDIDTYFGVEPVSDKKISNFIITDSAIEYDNAIYIYVTHNSIIISFKPMSYMLSRDDIDSEIDSQHISELEYSFLTFFVNKLIFAKLFKLNEINTAVQYYPNRQYISFNRSSLAISMIDYKKK